MPIVKAPAASGPTFFTDVVTLIGWPTAPRAGPDTESIARSGRMISTLATAVSPLSSSSDSSTTPALLIPPSSTTADTKYEPGAVPGGTVTAVVAGDSAPPPAREATVREPIRTPAPGVLSLAER